MYAGMCVGHVRPQLFWKGGGGQDRARGAPFDSRVYVLHFRPIQPVWGGGGGGCCPLSANSTNGGGGGWGVLSAFGRFNKWGGGTPLKLATHSSAAHFTMNKLTFH